jgi:hypothetical protein
VKEALAPGENEGKAAASSPAAATAGVVEEEPLRKRMFEADEKFDDKAKLEPTPPLTKEGAAVLEAAPTAEGGGSSEEAKDPVAEGWRAKGVDTRAKASELARLAGTEEPVLTGATAWVGGSGGGADRSRGRCLKGGGGRIRMVDATVRRQKATRSKTRG